MRFLCSSGAVLLSSVLVACGGTEAALAPPDGGADARTVLPDDGGSDGDASLRDAAVPPSDEVLADHVESLAGITSDGYVLFATVGAPQGVPGNAVSLEGGPVSVVIPPAATMPSWVATEIAGNALVYADSLSSDLTIWTHAHGLRTIARQDPLGSVQFAASQDGARVAYVDGPTIRMADSDGSNARTLVTGLATGARACGPMALFFLPNGDLLADYCLDPGSDAGASSYTVSVFASPSFTKRDLATHLQGPSLKTALGTPIDPTGTWLWAAATDGSGSLVNVATGATTLVDSNVGDGFFDASGHTLFYASSGALKRVAVANPTAPAVVASDYDQAIAISPDGQYVLYVSPSHDTKVASTGAQSAPVTLSGGGGYGTVENFTADSRFVVYMSAHDSKPPTPGMTELRAAPASSGAPDVIFTTDVRGSYSTHDSTILYGDVNAHALMTADVATSVRGAQPRVFAATGGAEAMGYAGFRLTRDRKRVVYVNAVDHTLHVAQAP